MPLWVMHVQKSALLSSGRVCISAVLGRFPRGKGCVRDQLRLTVQDGNPRWAHRGRLRVVSRPAAQNVPHGGVRGVCLEGERLSVHAGRAVASSVQRAHDLARSRWRSGADDAGEVSEVGTANGTLN